MTTKAPSAVQDFAPDSLEKTAYASVSTIPTAEPNDRNRLGYHVWRWLQSRQGTIEDAVSESGVRMDMSKAEASRIIGEELRKHGVKLP